jgi:DNA-binding transcriptional MerR regulator
MLIGELALNTGASRRSLRHYEHLGLICSVRGRNGYRNYAVCAVEAVQAIQYLMCSGLKLSTITEVLPTLLNQKCKLTDPHVRGIIEYEVAKIQWKIKQLERSYAVLTGALGKGHIRRPGT